MPASESAETLLPVVSVRDLKPDDKNPNKGTKRGSQLIEKSLQSYGFGRSIVVDKNNKIIAGNKTQENLVQLGMTEEPIIVDTDGRRPIIHRRVDLDLDSDPRARELSLADNRTNQLSLAWDAQVLALLKDDGINLREFWTEEELEEVLSEEGADSMMPPSDGSLLSLVNVTIAEPKHRVERGEVYKLGEHILCCVEVMKEWPIWKPFLKTEKHLFIPYPGPYAPLTLRAERSPLVMVQPDTYIAGHVIDRWCEVNGDGKVSKVT
jgi:hypothetical protein